MRLYKGQVILCPGLLTRWLFTPAQEMLIQNLIDGIIEESAKIKRQKLLIVAGLFIFLVIYMIYVVFYGIIRSIREYKNSMMMLSILPIHAITNVGSIKQFMLTHVVH